jgi:hypothetical protein
MRFGVLKSGAMFVTAFAAMFAALTVGAPAAKSQVGLLQRMTFMHQNAQLHFSIVDPTQRPTPAASETVGKFVSATSQSSNLVEGHAYPNHINPDYLYGVTKDGFTIRRVGQTGSLIDTISFGNLFTRVTGAFLVTNEVAVNPQWVPRAYDLKEHFVITGEVNQGNLSLVGNSTGMMMVNPKTMAGYKVANASMFLGQDSTKMFEDVCFGVYPGPDADYATTQDNQYRYVVFVSQDQTFDHQLFCLSLNEHESMNGVDPPSPWNPVPQERGPDYTNVYPIINANPHTETITINAVDNGQMFCRSYYARPELAAVVPNLQTDVTYVIAGWVRQIPANPIQWRVEVQGYSLGLDVPIVTVTAALGLLQTTTDDLLKGISIVGDWAIISIGDGNAGDGFADEFASIYLPAFFDNTPAGGYWGNGAGYAGYHPNISGHPVITYVGPGAGSSVASATTRDPFLFHAGGILGNMTGIDMHTEEEKLLGLNFRRAPQPFVGFFFSEDPADSFPGFRDGSGGGNGSGGCSGSADGAPGHAVGLIALLGVSFLVLQILREARRS